MFKYIFSRLLSLTLKDFENTSAYQFISYHISPKIDCDITFRGVKDLGDLKNCLFFYNQQRYFVFKMDDSDLLRLRDELNKAFPNG